MSETIISLPWPMSVNGTFKKYNGKRLSETYRAWRDEAGIMLKRQKPRPIYGRVAVTIHFCPPDNRIRDMDNLLKGVLDLLVKHRVIEKDDMRFYREGHQYVVDQGEPCVVTVRGIE